MSTLCTAIAASTAAREPSSGVRLLGFLIQPTKCRLNTLPAYWCNGAGIEQDFYLQSGLLVQSQHRPLDRVDSQFNGVAFLVEPVAVLHHGPGPNVEVAVESDSVQKKICSRSWS